MVVVMARKRHLGSLPNRHFNITDTHLGYMYSAVPRYLRHKDHLYRPSHVTAESPPHSNRHFYNGAEHPSIQAA
jgi:hypothetical protein